MTEIRFTRRALIDLSEIERHSIEIFGRKVADKYMADIDDALETISEYPDILRKESFTEKTRIFRIREHVFVFALFKDVLYLLTVKYVRMDIENILTRLEPALMHEVEILHERLTRA